MIVLRALAAALLLAACGPPPAPALNVEGQPCGRDGDCAAGLVCKAAQCGPLRARPGRPCVTAAGCAEGLACLSGRCSLGLASEPMCRGACKQMREVFEREALDELRNVGSDPAGPDAARAAPDADERAAIDAAAGADFGRRCLARCLGLTREQALCLQEVRTVDEIARCQ